MQTFGQFGHSLAHRTFHCFLRFAYPLAGHLSIDTCYVFVADEWSVSLASGDNIAALPVLLVECKTLLRCQLLAVKFKAVTHLLQLSAHLWYKAVVVTVGLQLLTLSRMLLPVLVNELSFLLTGEHLVYLAPA